MTYGEYYYRIKSDMHLKDGIWVTHKPQVTIPPRMPRQEALEYYTKKINEYFLSASRYKKIR